MNDDVRRAVIEQFCHPRGLSPDLVSEGLADTIYYSATPYLLMVECLGELESDDPTIGLQLKLIDRTYETVTASLSLVYLRHFREAEILSRSIFESAVTTCYIAKEAPATRFGQFFLAYVRQEREKNRKWKNEIENITTGAKQEHLSRIDQKDRALDQYDQFISGFLEHCGVSPDRASKWPGLIDRLSVVGHKIEYRTVYAAMCSQAHHDAQDVLNYFFANSIESGDQLANRMERETDTFSVFMLLFGIKWFVEATSSVCNRLGYYTAVAEAVKSLAIINEEFERLTIHLDEGTFPERWQTKPFADSTNRAAARDRIS